MTTLTNTMARLSPTLYLRLLDWLCRRQWTRRNDGWQATEATLRRQY
jgi:hypothetical protein